MGGAPGWRGRVALPPGRLYFHGEIGPAALHSHRAVQVLVADEPFVLCGRDGVGHASRAAVIPSRAWHSITGPSRRGFLALIEPSSAIGRSLADVPADEPAAWAFGPPPAIPREDAPLIESADAILGGLTGSAIASPDGHPVLTKALEAITSALPARLRIAEVAREVHLSESRLAHLFADRLGLTFRAHVRWERVRLALTMLSEGETLGRVAHAAGFSDAAHLSRTFRAMFGSAPSELIRGVVWEGRQVRASGTAARPPTLEA